MGSPWSLTFADDNVKYGESREQLADSLEGRRMNVSRHKTKYMCANDRERCVRVKLQGVEVVRVD